MSTRSTTYHVASRRRAQIYVDASHAQSSAGQDREVSRLRSGRSQSHAQVNGLRLCECRAFICGVSTISFLVVHSDADVAGESEIIRGSGEVTTGDPAPWIIPTVLSHFRCMEGFR